ncbi:MAG TPA: hypothetical protein ENN87_04640 [Phycisphaerales bacterium]|nr:hypothetical protein [Phycisphaerales bacterium]
MDIAEAMQAPFGVLLSDADRQTMVRLLLIGRTVTLRIQQTPTGDVEVRMEPSHDEAERGDSGSME